MSPSALNLILKTHLLPIGDLPADEVGVSVCCKLDGGVFRLVLGVVGSMSGVGGVLLVNEVDDEVVFRLVFCGEGLVVVGDDKGNVGRLFGSVKFSGDVGEGFGEFCHMGTLFHQTGHVC
ncbi:hypothetical protein Tco_0199979 [Tanacetum coccineum]